MERICTLLLTVALGQCMGLRHRTESSTKLSYQTVTTLDSGRILLSCKMAVKSGPVTWLRPGDHMPVTTDYDVIDELQPKLQVLGDPRKKEYNLLINYVRYPEDSGNWTCSNIAGGQHISNLLVLVPPTIYSPCVTPSNLSVLDLSREALTFTCSSQYAFPPVDLRWVKVRGPELPYDVTPPSMLVSEQQTVVVSVRLLVSAWHLQASVFACEARHPTFRGKVYTQQTPLPTPYTLESRAPGAGAPPQARHLAGGTAGSYSSPLTAGLTFTPLDRCMVVILCVVLSVAFAALVCLVRTRRHWRLDVRLRRDDDVIAPTSEMELLNGDAVNGEDTVRKPPLEKTGKGKGNSQAYRRARRCCILQTAVGAIFSILLLLSLILAIPIYLKGVSIPPLGTDAMTSVLAGSALWLDCSRLVHPPSSLLQVTWRKNTEPFYHQYLLNDRHIAFPHNSTLGYMLGGRVTSQRAGQINVWPMLPGESDAYTCEVALVSDNEGRTVIRRLTTAVFVTMGPVKNWAVIILIGLALFSAAVVTAVGCSHTLAWSCSTPSSKKPGQK